MPEFVTSPNQRRVTIHKYDHRNGYTKIDREGNLEAMRVLGYSAYVLYMYFCNNATGFNMILSAQKLLSDTGLSRTTYYEAFNELVEKGFLVCKPGMKCIFDFYEKPDLQSGASPEKQKVCSGNQKSTCRKAVENILNIKNKGNRGSVEILPAISTENKMESYALEERAEAHLLKQQSLFYDM